MSNIPWTRNQILLLLAVIVAVFGAVFTLIGKININIQHIANKVDTLETRILEIKESGIVGGDFVIGGHATATQGFVVGTDEDYIAPACIGLMTADGYWVFAYANSASEIINQGLTWSRTDCSSIPSTTTVLFGQKP